MYLSYLELRFIKYNVYNVSYLSKQIKSYKRVRNNIIKLMKSNNPKRASVETYEIELDITIQLYNDG